MYSRIIAYYQNYSKFEKIYIGTYLLIFIESFLDGHYLIKANLDIVDYSFQYCW